ncbi:hypothetical protein H257_04789 [Aphanomyces astaci]|uniref:DDE Tnp4 domain-containing protein n=1 Tax=Aphanomyces astaci TaxID=112090 RepID=W4GUT6_APHAT|nr:hypothetical protein H257_04789 [Aphanomyces astaci]ETV83046.1 hypothetical protein H257_04789 [Aphanomyces astaci]|eukprot:XP_009827717.1 hypothetical protein H257_04789 [Aphanomyces astaci]
MDSFAIVSRLQQQVDDDVHALDEMSQVYHAHSQHVEEADDSPTPVIDSFFSQGGNASLSTMTNFTLSEFESIWAIVESAMDAFFMAMSVLKHCNAYDKHAFDYKMKAPTFEKMIHRVFDTVELILYEHFVKPISMTYQVQHGHTFNNFPSALYCTDVKFQPSYRPTGRFDEAKHYFSGKHKLYGLKLEYSVAYPGVAVDMSEHSPGSVADVTMFMHRRHVHKDMLRKSASEMEEVDHDEGAEEYPDSWSILVDMGYQGIQHEVRSMQPKRRPQGGLLTARELERNDRVSSDRVLAIQCTGVKAKWSIKGSTRAFCVLYFDAKKLRRHIDDEVLRLSSEPPHPPPVLDDVEPKLARPFKEYLAKTSFGQRSIALVYALEAVRRYARLQTSWLRDKFCSEEQQFASAVDVYTKFHGLKFEKHCSTYGSQATFDKFRKLRDLVPQDWNELTQKFPDFLDAKPTAHALPVHGYDQAPETTRSSDLRLSSYDIYGQTTGLSPLRSQRDMPFLVHSTKMRCDATSTSHPNGWRSRQGNSHHTAVANGTNTAKVEGVPPRQKDPPIAHAAALPMAVNTEAATPKAALVRTTTVIQTAATPKAAISNKATPKAAENELRLRTDAINVTKSYIPSKMTGEAAVAASTKVAPVKIPEETTIVAAQLDVRLYVTGSNGDPLAIYLQDVYPIPELHFNLFSVGRALHMDRHRIVSIDPNMDSSHFKHDIVLQSRHAMSLHLPLNRSQANNHGVMLRLARLKSFQTPQHVVGYASVRIYRTRGEGLALGP